MLPRRAWPSQPLISDAFDALGRVTNTPLYEAQVVGDLTHVGVVRTERPFAGHKGALEQPLAFASALMSAGWADAVASAPNVSAARIATKATPRSRP
jgi:hypothetical protein